VNSAGRCVRRRHCAGRCARRPMPRLPRRSRGAAFRLRSRRRCRLHPRRSRGGRGSPVLSLDHSGHLVAQLRPQIVPDLRVGPSRISPA
jgi:hypothetical protein